MSTDDLSTPLQGQRTKRRRFRLPFSATQAIATLLGLFLAGFVGFAIFGGNPFGGEPIARVPIEPSAQISKAADTAAPKAVAAPEAPAKPADAAGQRTITIIDGSSGTRRDVTVPDADAGEPAQGKSAPVSAAIDPRLLEAGRHGSIPIVSAEGLKPSKAYAAGNEALRAKAATLPNVAIVIAGLGIGTAKSTDAIMKLPGAVTLAFTPYGTEAAKLAERARAQGHELLLQLPMEPFDYPDNDPGPQTLLTSLSTEQNLDRLHWHLGRIQGYVGLANFMGARFVTNEKALDPVMREAAKRGLVFLDDGSASRSVTSQVADALAVAYEKADATIDSVPTAAEIDRALARLEGIAKQRGAAIGFASALPVSIERIAVWSKALEGRGVVLVPLTMAIAKDRPR